MIAVNPSFALLLAALASAVLALLLAAMLWRPGERARRMAMRSGVALGLLALFQATLLALMRLWPGLAAVGSPAEPAPQPHWPVVLNDIALLLAVACLLLALRRQRHAAERESGTDPLTGLPNRQGFTALYAAARQELLLRGRAMTLLILDIDHFKGITDRHGRAVGDQVLMDFCRRVRMVIGDAPLARIGGEEFAVLAPLNGGDALRLGQEIRHLLGRERSSGLPIYNCSVGLASATARANSLEALLGAADKALYYARQDDRNRVASAAPEEAPA
jgi:diguanylate cyclase (GGDEF)-like protein